jgi:hypothetical protein
MLLNGEAQIEETAVLELVKRYFQKLRGDRYDRIRCL